MIARALFIFSVLLISPTTLAKTLPNVELVHFEDQTKINTEDLKGKVLYLDFWASWCKPCRKSFPFMNQLHTDYQGKDFAVVAINMDEFPDDAKTFLSQLPAQFDVFTEPGNTLAEQLEVPGLPVAYIIDKKGNIAARHIGFNDRKKQKKIKQINYLLEQQ